MAREKIATFLKFSSSTQNNKITTLGDKSATLTRNIQCLGDVLPEMGFSVSLVMFYV